MDQSAKSAPAERQARQGLGPFAPLRERTFAVIWSSSVLSNFGQLILGVGAAWEMTRLAGDPKMVALVQSAMMLPLMLVAVPSGAAADMFDRRKVALSGLGFAIVCAATLATLSLLDLTTPWVLLAFCALIGIGVALYGPAWQASVGEQVSREQLPAAVALGSISFNVARSFGPAVGGAIILLAGAKAAFAVTAVAYLPLLAAFYFWRRKPAIARLPPERMDRAIISGARYAVHSPPIRTVLLRSILYGIAGSAVAALTPIIASKALGGGAGMYGVLLGVYGTGAIGGAMLAGPVRWRYSSELIVNVCAVVTGAMTIVIGLSHNALLTGAAMMVSGAAWMLLVTILNLGVQLSAPRWVTARALSLYTSSLTGGIAVGAWFWGDQAGNHGVGAAMIASGVALILSPFVGLLLPLPSINSAGTEPAEIGNEPDVALAITLKSGPVVIEVDYEVDPSQARQFYDAMLKLQRARLRNGAFDWSLSRDIGDPALWRERYLCPTWGDYLRLRSRFTHSDRALQDAALSLTRTGASRRVRRMLERPFGSVRWRAETPDPLAGSPIVSYTP